MRNLRLRVMRFFCLYVILMGVGVGTVFGVAYAALSLGWTEHLFDAVGGGLACFAFELWVAAHAVHPSGDWTVEWPQLTRAHVKRGLTEFKNDALDWLEIMIVGLLWLMLVVSAL